MEQLPHLQTCYRSPDFGDPAFQSWIPKWKSRNKPVRSASKFNDPSLSGFAEAVIAPFFSRIPPVQGRGPLANGLTGVSKEGICDEQRG